MNFSHGQEYVFTNKLYIDPNLSILKKYVINYKSTEDFEAIIEGIKDNTFEFYDKHKFVIIRNNITNTYTIVSKLFVYIYILKRMTIYTFRNINLFRPDFCESFQNILEIIERPSILDKKIYTCVIDKIPEKSIFNLYKITDDRGLFDNTTKVIKRSTYTDYCISIIESVGVPYRPYIACDINTIGFHNRTIIISYNHEFINSIKMDLYNTSFMFFDSLITASNYNRSNHIPREFVYEKAFIYSPETFRYKNLDLNTEQYKYSISIHKHNEPFAEYIHVKREMFIRQYLQNYRMSIIKLRRLDTQKRLIK